ncbi:BlaI/MecI/CopY family transcriptional regulator [Gilvimarinus sp. F26214L]|uniref:BlaI/MecI/CopY family transcriptional regulator n=1 Tax=Gilvimarinus sp. DZF01 TaxID=3461371 RepID=UPI0040463821
MKIPRLGDLEVAVLDCVWAEGSVSAKDAHRLVGDKRGISLNTVQSALERLHRKHLLSRSKQSHAYLYAPAIEREQVMAALINEVLGRFGGDAPTSVAAILNATEQLDEASLSLLEAEIQNRRERSV